MDSIPGIKLEEYGYEGFIELSAWDDYLAHSNGVYDLDIGGDMVVDNPSITKEHIAAYNYAIDNQDRIRHSIIESLMKKYPELQNEYGYDEDEANELMPEITTPEGFKKLIGLSAVHIMNVYKNGMAYTGYEFTCTWDKEHGFGVMMFQDTVIDIGEADTSFLTWIAKKDLKEE